MLGKASRVWNYKVGGFSPLLKGQVVCAVTLALGCDIAEEGPLGFSLIGLSLSPISSHKFALWWQLVLSPSTAVPLPTSALTLTCHDEPLLLRGSGCAARRQCWRDQKELPRTGAEIPSGQERRR